MLSNSVYSSAACIMQNVNGILCCPVSQPLLSLRRNGALPNRILNNDKMVTNGNLCWCLSSVCSVWIPPHNSRRGIFCQSRFRSVCRAVWPAWTDSSHPTGHAPYKRFIIYDVKHWHRGKTAWTKKCTILPIYHNCSPYVFTSPLPHPTPIPQRTFLWQIWLD